MIRRKINLETHDAAVPTIASQAPRTSRSATIDAYVNARSSSPRAFRASMKSVVLHYVHRVWDAERIVKMLISAGADVNVRGAPFPYCSGGVPLLDMDPDYSRSRPDVVMSRRITPLLLRAGASMYYIYGPPYYNPYLQKIYDMCPEDCSKRFKAYEKRHANALVAIFVPKLRLPRR